jgi:uncharacterized protein
MKSLSAIAFALSLAGAAAAQETTSPADPVILVSGSGTIKTPPDMATIAYTVRGEGATSDEAVKALTNANKTIEGGLATVLGGMLELHTSRLTISQVRPRTCDDNGYGARRLSTGDCAVIGYIALLPVTVDSPRVKDVGTATGLAGRLGGTEVRIQEFWLRDRATARRQALQAALANAHDQAQLIAESSGSKLGRLIRVSDGDYDRREFIATDIHVEAPPAPPPPPAPIRVDLKPELIETTARLTVSYAIAP